MGTETAGPSYFAVSKKVIAAKIRIMTQRMQQKPLTGSVRYITMQLSEVDAAFCGKGGSHVYGFSE